MHADGPNARRSSDTSAIHMTGKLRAAAGSLARCGLIIFAAVLIVALTPAGALAQADQPREVLVGLRPTVQPAAQMMKIQMRTGARVKKSLARGRVLVMDVPPDESPVRFKNKLLREAAVEFVEPNGMMYPAAVTPNDPEYPQQFHLPLIRAPEAWEVTTGRPEIVIAVVDTGVDLQHPDLAPNIWRNPNETLNGRDDDGNGFVDDIHGWDFQNNTNNPRPQPTGADENNDGTPDEQVNHGTLVAGLAAAVGNDGFGTAGVAWNVKIMPIQVFPSDGGASVDQVIEGIDYAIMMGADIINLSIGGGYYESFNAPIRQAYEQGILVVTAAGNAGVELRDSRSTWESPVCNVGPNPGDNFVFGVGSTDANDIRASFSNYDGSTLGKFVDVVAPGEGLYGPTFYDPGFPAFSSYFGTNSGTSFSVPLVSGLAALILSQNPGMPPAEVMAAIRAGADNIDALNPGFAGKLGAGRINCARSLGVALPPRAVRDLLAVDTPDDQGGSITVTWQLSLDDGAGANNVTEYIILRRRGEDGSFAEVGRVDAGTTRFVDETVTDGRTYYYLVRTSDGSLTSDSAVAGPVQSENDGAPPAVTGVYAEDRPADDGGAIVVGWDDYDAPSDFSHFAIYRALTNFNSVAAMEPIAELADAGATEYVDATTTDGVGYWYAVIAVDTFGNQRMTVTPIGPVQSFANGPVTIGAGMHFFATPVEPADREPATLLEIGPDELQMARWSSTARDYVIYQGPGSLPLRLGRGYWLKLNRSVTFTPAGNMAPTGSFRIDLAPGWQQVGNPYFSAIDMSAATVEYQGTTMDLASADAAGVLRQVLWTYDPATNGYAMIAPFLENGDMKIDPWEGFWVRVEKRCSLILPRPGVIGTRTQSVPAQSGASDGDGWFTRLSVRGEAGADMDNFFGVSPKLASMAPLHSPPRSAAGVELAFTDTAGQRLAGQFSAVEAREQSWDLVVAGNPGERLEIWCPTPGEIPDGWAVTLEDHATGARTDIRRGARYATTLGSDESQRSMSLRLTRTAGALTLSSLSAVASRAGGAELTFTLSAPADCTVRVLNIAGRTVRVLRQGTPMPAGTSQLVWNGRSDAGLPVPNGTYLVQVDAAAEDGRRTQAVRTLAIGR